MQNPTFSKISKKLQSLKNSRKAVFLQKYFKTGKGEYGEGDKFLGLTVPQVRAVARDFSDLSLADVAKLLESSIHEYRFAAVEILGFKYEILSKIENVDNSQKKIKELVDFYLKHTKGINNWDLVDNSAPQILGRYLYESASSRSSRKILYKLVRSKNIWERRIAIVATLYFIWKDDFGDTLAIAELLLADSHDLIHKASGWMLREVGKRNVVKLERFLARHARKMPRTMLRYSIEKFAPAKRKSILNNK